MECLPAWRLLMMNNPTPVKGEVVDLDISDLLPVIPVDSVNAQASIFAML